MKVIDVNTYRTGTFLMALKQMKFKQGAWMIAAAVMLLLGVAPVRAQDAVRFDIFEFRVEGNSLMKQEAIERAIMGSLGESKTFADVQAARAALEKTYHDAGYLSVLVRIPEQQVQSGVVVLQVTEVEVGRLRVVGSKYNLPSALRERLESVSEGQVPNFAVLQQNLGAINKGSDLKVAPVLKPGAEPGTLDIQLEVEDQVPFHGSVEINNRQPLNATPTRVIGSLRYDNLWQESHSFGLTYQASPEKPSETQAFILNYQLPIKGSTDSLSFYSVQSNSQFASLAGSGYGVIGNAQIYGVRYALSFDSNPKYQQSVTFGWDYKNTAQSGDSSQQIRYAPASLNYRGVWVGDVPKPSVIDITVVLGMRGFPGQSENAFDPRLTLTPGASANFTSYRTALQLNREVGRWGLAANMDLQMASGPLLPNERYIAGGADTVRGYYEGERTGDQALRFSFELLAPAFRASSWLGTDWGGNFMAFVDEAAVVNAQPAAGQLSRYVLASAGLGLRFNSDNGLKLQLDIARALEDGNLASFGTKQGDWRAHVRLTKNF